MCHLNCRDLEHQRFHDSNIKINKKRKEKKKKRKEKEKKRKEKKAQTLLKEQ
jgi:hypothetical protein